MKEISPGEQEFQEEEQLARAEQLTPTLVTASIEDLDKIRGILHNRDSHEGMLLSALANTLVWAVGGLLTVIYLGLVFG